MRRAQTLVWMVLSLFLVSMLLACESPGTPTVPTGGSPVAGPKVLRVAIESEIPGLDGHGSCTWAVHRVRLNMYEGLIAQDLSDPNATPTKLLPGLAESWKWSSDRTELTYHIRKGVKFHDGTDLDANAVDWNVRRVWRPSETEQAPQYYPPNAAGQRWPSFVKDVQVIDQYTFKVILKNPVAEFERMMNANQGCQSLMIVSPAAVERYGQEGFSKNPVGTGPFRFVELIPGDRLVMERNPDYWGTKPKLDRIIVRPFTSMPSMVSAFRRGELDVIAAVPPDNIEDLKADGYGVVTNESPGEMYLHINFKETATQDVRVRRAMAMAINKKSIADELLSGAAAPAEGILSWGAPAYDPSFKGIAYDAAQAKTLMKQAGYSDSKRLAIRMVTCAGGSGTIAPIPISLAIQDQLKAIYIDVKVETYEFNACANEFVTGLKPGNHMFITPYGGSFNGWMRQILHSEAAPPGCCNGGYYSNPEVDKLLEEATISADPQAADEKIRRVNDIVVNKDVAVIPVLVSKEPVAHQPYVKNLVLPHEAWFALWTLDIEK